MPACITHTEVDVAWGSTQLEPALQPPPPLALTGHARATVLHEGGVRVGVLVPGAHEPVSAGAATVTAAVKIALHEAVGVTGMFADIEQMGSS